MRFLLVLLCILALTLPTVDILSLPSSDVRAQEPRELEAFQGYLEAAPDGMDVYYAWSQEGGRGENVKIIDIEFNWNLTHNDLAHATADPFVLVRGIDPVPEFNLDHGTAVLGMLVAAPDGIGVTGIAHGAKVGLVNPLTEGTTPKLAEAITFASRRLEAGDVMLVELQSIAGPRFNTQTGAGLVPVEYEPDVFQAIKSATSRGIVVVEASANGFENLDDPVYQGAFNRSQRDSGAIIVGAGLPPAGLYGSGPDRARTEESNYGSRVDVQGWGRFITTTGYGDLRREQGVNNWYTINFGFTSGAAAMVAGAAALIQSIVKARGQAPIPPAQLRRLLTTTGTPQAGDTSKPIGPRPDLRAAIAALDSQGQDNDPRITAVKYKRGAGKLIVDGENFRPNDSVIEIDGTAIARHKYPSAYFLPGGTTSRVMSKGNVSGLLPAGSEVSITIFTPSTGKRSAPVSLRP
ncbi:MAG TPA: S8 family serine peptidase [Blastocatellia bacterium]|nr:S8 family serine peptidase [Blastocatellia bacterium]